MFSGNQLKFIYDQSDATAENTYFIITSVRKLSVSSFPHTFWKRQTPTVVRIAGINCSGRIFEVFCTNNTMMPWATLETVTVMLMRKIIKQETSRLWRNVFKNTWIMNQYLNRDAETCSCTTQTCKLLYVCRRCTNTHISNYSQTQWSLQRHTRKGLLVHFPTVLFDLRLLP